MADRTPRWIGGALLLGLLAALAGPVWLVRQYLRPEPWNPRVRFASMRYEAGGLVFTYVVENRTRRTVRFLPDTASIHAIQSKGSTAEIYVSAALPLELDGHSSRSVEVRLELPSEPPGVPHTSHRQDGPMPGSIAPGASDLNVHVSPLPTPGQQAETAADQPAPQKAVEDPLTSIEGFELIQKRTGLKIVFPRAW
jgi:hypothetical protein